jgi:branched-chain amino acid transport system ATP-binding protein
MSLLIVDGIVKHFGGVKALNGCSLKVEEGSITGLIGPNGAGKTTLFNVISGLIKPDRGTVHFQDRPIHGMKSHRLARRGVIRTFQMTREIQRLTVRENLLLAASDQAGLNVFEALFGAKRVRENERENLDKADALLDFFALAHLRDVPASSLSGGQRKLLDLARCLMSDPRILLLDEPTSGVNPVLAETIADRIKKLQQERGLTFFIVEHNMGFLERLSDRVVVMAEGATLLEGPLDVVRQHPEVLEAYLGHGMGAAPTLLHQMKKTDETKGV